MVLNLLTKITTYIYLILLLVYSNSIYADCLNFIPYYFTGKSHKIIENREFCVKNFSDEKINYLSDKFGARVLSNYPNKPIKVFFGDSQLLGLDVNAEDHNFFPTLLELFEIKFDAVSNMFLVDL